MFYGIKDIHFKYSVHYTFILACEGLYLKPENTVVKFTYFCVHVIRPDDGQLV